MLFKEFRTKDKTRFADNFGNYSCTNIVEMSAEDEINRCMIGSF